MNKQIKLYIINFKFKMLIKSIDIADETIKLAIQTYSNALYTQRYEPYYIAASRIFYNRQQVINDRYLLHEIFLFAVLCYADNSVSTLQIQNISEICAILLLAKQEFTAENVFNDSFKTLGQNPSFNFIDNARNLIVYGDEFQQAVVLAQNLFRSSPFQDDVKNKIYRIERVEINLKNTDGFETIINQEKSAPKAKADKHDAKTGYISFQDLQLDVWKDLSTSRFRGCFKDSNYVRRTTKNVKVFKNDNEAFTENNQEDYSDKQKLQYQFPLVYSDRGKVLVECKNASQALQVIVYHLLKPLDRDDWGDNNVLVRYDGLTCNVQELVDLAETLPITGPRYIPLSRNMLPMDDDGKELFKDGNVEVDKVYTNWRRRRRSTLAVLIMTAASFETSNRASSNLTILLKEWATMSQLYRSPIMQLHILDGENKFTEKGVDRLCEVIMRSFLKLYMLREDPKIARPATTGYSLYMDNIYLTARKNNVFPLKDPHNICGTGDIKTPLTVNDVIGSLCLNYPQTVSGIAIDLQRYIDKLDP